MNALAHSALEARGTQDTHLQSAASLPATLEFLMLSRAVLGRLFLLPDVLNSISHSESAT